MFSVKKLNDRIFFRTMFTAFGFRPAGHNRQDFIPYFQYRLGSFSTDFYLYFRRQPGWGLYKEEIFNKLDEYSGYDIIRYLEFHFGLYPDKAGFLRFLRYEALERVKRTRRGRKEFRIKLEMVLFWVGEREAPEQEIQLSRSGAGGMAAEEVEIKVGELMQSFTGSISMHGKHHLERMVQLLILVKDLKLKGMTGQRLFRDFSNTDLAAVMRNFEAFRGMRLNTLQKKITEMEDELRINDPKVVELVNALTNFFS